MFDDPVQPIIGGGYFWDTSDIEGQTFANTSFCERFLIRLFVECLFVI